jgi:S-DNA-T family DNA segregation ATPase FtsK/SpoIIIE
MTQHPSGPDDPHQAGTQGERRHPHAVGTPADQAPVEGVPTAHPTTVPGEPTTRIGDGPSDEAGPSADEGLRAGDALADVEALTSAPVDGHLIPLLRPTAAQRWTARTSGVRAPLVPAWVSDAQVRREAAARTAKDVAYTTGYRSLRLPWDVARLAWYAVVGARRLGWRVTRWAFDIDGHPLIGEVTARDDRAYVRMAHDRTIRQKWRFTLLSVLTLVALIVAAVVDATAPWWVLPALTTVTAVTLARYGTPVGTALLSPAVRKDVKVPLTSQAIVQALSVLGITGLTKSLAVGSERIWRSGIATIRGGYVVHLQLPPGVVASELVPHEDRMAAALGRPKDTVIVTPLPHVTPSDLRLFILDRPILSGKPATWPLASKRKVSVFDTLPLGIDRIGDPYRLPLIEQNVFTGGIPGSGKSAMVRVIAAAAALDPLSRLSIVNLKGTPDFLALEAVCHRYLSGNPDSDRDIVPAALTALAEVATDLGHRATLLTTAARKQLAPDSKITRELAHQVPGLRPHVLVIDEAHRLFDGSEADAAKAADLLTRIVRLGRAHGVILVLATQLGDADSVPPALLRMASVRMCMRVSDHIALNQLLGNGASRVLGVPSDFAPGTGLVRTATGTVKIRSYYLDGPALTDIGKRALALRSDLRVLTGDAAGDPLTPTDRTDPADLLKDVLAAIPTTAPVGGRADSDVAWLTELETALTQRPGYAGRAPGWLAGELRARKVPTEPLNRRVPVDVRASGQRNETGVRATTVQAALAELLTTDPGAPAS